MRVTFLIAGLGAGGAERVISLISRRWVQMGWQVTIVAFDYPHDPVYHDFDPAVRLVRLGLPTVSGKRLAGLIANVRRVFRLRRFLKRDQPDVAISFLTKINAIALLASRGLGIPVIASERNNPGRQFSHPLWTFLVARLYGDAAAVVMQTRASIACLPAPARNRAVVIPNPIPRNAPAGTAFLPLTLAGVGRLIPQKGFDLLILAFARIAHEHQDWRLVIWGEGDARESLEALVRALDLEDRVSLPGLSPPGAWTGSTSLFALSSRFEGFPNVLGEAMAAGLPVVAFDCPFGPAEMIHHEQDGLIVTAEDVAQLASAIGRLMGDPALRDQIGYRARRSIRQFDMNSVSDAWTRLVRETLPKNLDSA